MGWVPDEAWLTKVVVDASADELNFEPGHRRFRRREALAGRCWLRSLRTDVAGAPRADRPLPRSRGRTRHRGLPIMLDRATRAGPDRAPVGGRHEPSASPGGRRAARRGDGDRRVRRPGQVTVTITIHHSAFDLTEVSVPTGVPVTFVLVNEGGGTDRPRMADRRRGIPPTRTAPAPTPRTATCRPR